MSSLMVEFIFHIQENPVVKIFPLQEETDTDKPKQPQDYGEQFIE